VKIAFLAEVKALLATFAFRLIHFSLQTLAFERGSAEDLSSRVFHFQLAQEVLTHRVFELMSS